MKLTEQSTVAEHLKALAEAEPEKFIADSFGRMFNFWLKGNVPSIMVEIDLVGERLPKLTQDDWDSILREIGWEYEVFRSDLYDPTIPTAPTWRFYIRITSGGFPVHAIRYFDTKSLAASAAGCAAIREYLKGKP